MYTNDTVGGLLNASFGNATEVIISGEWFSGKPHCQTVDLDPQRSVRHCSRAFFVSVHWFCIKRSPMLVVCGWECVKAHCIATRNTMHAKNRSVTRDA